MNIEGLRDLAIVIFALTASVALVFLGVLAFLLYRRARSLLGTLKETNEAVSEIVTYAKNVYKPVVQVMAVVQAVMKGVNLVREHGKKEKTEAECDDEKK